MVKQPWVLLFWAFYFHFYFGFRLSDGKPSAGCLQVLDSNAAHLSLSVLFEWPRFFPALKKSVIKSLGLFFEKGSVSFAEEKIKNSPDREKENLPFVQWHTTCTLCQLGVLKGFDVCCMPLGQGLGAGRSAGGYLCHVPLGNGTTAHAVIGHLAMPPVQMGARLDDPRC